MRLTDDQIRQTVAAMRAGEKVKAALLAAALAGDPAARFQVMALAKRQGRAA